MHGTSLLRGERVYLSAWTKEDVPIVTKWYQDGEFLRLLDAPPAHPRTPRQTETWMEEADKSKEMFSFAIRTVESDQLIGLIELEGILWNHGNAWLGIGIGEPGYWGQGFGSEAIALTLRFAFWELNLHRIQLTVFEYNTRAIAAYKKLGFVREGAFREFIQRDGQSYDLILYGLLRREWEARNAP